MKFYLFNTGTCTRVRLFGEDVRTLLKINGYYEVKNPFDADYIFVNTCSFLKSKSDYFLNFIKELNWKISSSQKIVIIGCLGGSHKFAINIINPNIIIFKRDIESIKEYFHFDKLPKAKNHIVGQQLSKKQKIISLLNQYLLHSKHIDYRLKQDKVCYIQMSIGCQGTCSYCSEKFITKLKSHTVPEIIEAVYDGIDRGFTLFGLSSDDASAYGKDIGTSLDELLKELVKINSDIYFNIPEFNPQGLSKTVMECLTDKKFLYITIPIQSGSQKILDKMQRPYQIKDVMRKVKNIKENNPDLMINTHIIVGFPGETDEDFNETIKVLKTGLFDRVKVFKYSQQPGTKAASFPDQISDLVKGERYKKVLKVVRINNIKKHSLVNLILNTEQIKE